MGRTHLEAGEVVCGDEVGPVGVVLVDGEGALLGHVLQAPEEDEDDGDEEAPANDDECSAPKLRCMRE